MYRMDALVAIYNMLAAYKQRPYAERPVTMVMQLVTLRMWAGRAYQKVLTTMRLDFSVA